LCGDVRFPARTLCPHDLEVCVEHRILGEGTVYEMVRMNLAPEGFTPPYYAGYVDLDAGVRIFAQVAWSQGEPSPQHGDRVTLSVEVVTDIDEPVYGPMFRRTANHASF
jgi:uncharacterized OB-fold protein